MYLPRILFLLIIKTTAIGCTNANTVCYGPNGILCTTHKLSCISPQVIQIKNTLYGYRSGCKNIALTQCSNTTCCIEEPGDCFTPFTSDEHQQVSGNCSGLKTCTVFGFRESSGTKCGGTTSAYSKIQYDCVPKGDVAEDGNTGNVAEDGNTGNVAEDGNTDDVDEDGNIGAVVGGIFGAIIIFGILIVVLVFLYKRKKQRSKETIPSIVPPHSYVIDGPGTLNSRKDTSGYDEIELESERRVHATASHLQTNISNRNESSGYDEIELEGKPNTSTTVTDNYDHVGDDKLKVKSPKDLDNYNHIGTHDHSLHEDNYNHIGNNPSVSSNHLEADYNHINGVCIKPNDEDDYNHIGHSDKNNVITDDNYHHIGSGDINVEEGYDNDTRS